MFYQLLQTWDWLKTFSAVGRSENPGVPVLFGGHNRPPMVEIGLTDLPKSGGAMTPPAPSGQDDTPSMVPNADVITKFFIHFVIHHYQISLVQSCFC